MTWCVRSWLVDLDLSPVAEALAAQPARSSNEARSGLFGEPDRLFFGCQGPGAPRRAGDKWLGPSDQIGGAHVLSAPGQSRS